MAFNNYNQNDKDRRPTVNTYTPISFSHPGSKVMDTRLSISYFNKVMCLTIAARTNSNSDYPTYDTDNPVSIYLSYTKAKILHDAIINMLEKPNEINNICVEVKNGLVKVSNGIEYGTTNYCISIVYAKDNAETNEIIYETKSDIYYAAYNYDNKQYDTMNFPKMELDTFIMVLEHYFIASSYAYAAISREANMYNSKFVNDCIKGIAGKVGFQYPGAGNGNSSNAFTNKSFLNNNNSSVRTQINGDVPTEYKQSTFSDTANSLMDD